MCSSYPPPSRRRVRPSRRKGITVVEVLAALVVVSIGLLAMAGTSALALRAGNDAAVERQAVERAQSRLAELAAAGCVNALSGAADESADGVRERWVVDAPVAGVVTMETRAEWGSGPRSRRLVLRSAILC